MIASSDSHTSKAKAKYRVYWFRKKFRKKFNVKAHECLVLKEKVLKEKKIRIGFEIVTLMSDECLTDKNIYYIMYYINTVITDCYR